MTPQEVISYSLCRGPQDSLICCFSNTLPCWCNLHLFSLHGLLLSSWWLHSADYSAI